MIISGTVELFLKYGIRSITMDDIARELAVSKKTLYKYVSNKAELVDKCVRQTFSEIHEIIEDVITSSANAIDELFGIEAAVSGAMKSKHPALEFQLAKYYPVTWKWLEKQEQGIVMKHTRSNLEKGIQQGMYREELNVEYLSYLYYGCFSAMHDEQIVPRRLCENPEFMHEHLIYHLRGIVSRKGRDYLEEKLKNETTTQTTES